MPRAPPTPARRRPSRIRRSLAPSLLRPLGRCFRGHAARRPGGRRGPPRSLAGNRWPPCVLRSRCRSKSPPAAGFGESKPMSKLRTTGDTAISGISSRFWSGATFRMRSQARTAELLRRIFAAEGQIHGMSAESVHLHELGSLDTLVDIVGAVAGVAHLAPDTVAASPVNVGSGSVEAEHGTLEIPAPRHRPAPAGSADVLRRLRFRTHHSHRCGVDRPCRFVRRLAPDSPPSGSGTASGPPILKRAVPNALRVVWGLAPDRAGNAVIVVEATLDDLPPEIAPHLLERLLAAGARDAFFAPVQMKKGRAGLALTALADPEKRDAVVGTLFRESTTLGVRITEAERETLERRVLRVRTPWGPVGVKLGLVDGAVVNRAPGVRGLPPAGRECRGSRSRRCTGRPWRRRSPRSRTLRIRPAPLPRTVRDDRLARASRSAGIRPRPGGGIGARGPGGRFDRRLDRNAGRGSVLGEDLLAGGRAAPGWRGSLRRRKAPSSSRRWAAIPTTPGCLVSLVARSGSRNWRGGRGCWPSAKWGSTTTTTSVPRPQQRDVFRRQIRVARELGLPVVVHHRDAEDDFLQIADEEELAECGAILHCFTASERLARAAWERGFLLSFSGILNVQERGRPAPNGRARPCGSPPGRDRQSLPGAGAAPGSPRRTRHGHGDRPRPRRRALRRPGGNRSGYRR